ncbi:MAG: hypothetical protein ISR65_12245 [Bacteriovoracaceae bacterium]|nr:hypothetical protein [Bacteriovoracaceae bacterium]
MNITVSLKLLFIFLIFATAEAALPSHCYDFNSRISDQSLEIKLPKVTQLFCQAQNEPLLVGIRTIESSAGEYLLVLNPQTFKTNVIKRKCLKCFSEDSPDFEDSQGAILQSDYQDSPFYHMLETYTQLPGPMVERLSATADQNDGMVRTVAPTDGYVLTIDMCPSSKHGYERDLFRLFPDDPQVNQKIVKKVGGIPIGVAITGLWIKRHKAQLAEIKQLQKDGVVQITWINHSYSHPYYRNRPMSENFLVKQQSKFPREVLLNEYAMLTNGLIPSVFFRYPGLVSSRNLQQKLFEFSLIPVGSDAWIAKGQRPHPGSIILTHGNLNEHAGVVRLKKFLRRVRGSVNLVDITQTF